MATALVSPVVIEREPAARDNDAATAQTVARMCRYIRASLTDPIVRRWARESLSMIRSTPQGGEPTAAEKCWGVFWLIKHRVRFVEDDAALRALLNEPDQVELLISPAVLVRMSDPAEDCDGFTMLACAMLAILGVRTRIVTIACDPQDRSRLSHVFAQAEISPGEYQTLDASHGDAPGWQVPAEHTYRVQGWSLPAGDPIEVSMSHTLTLPMRQRRGLHGYVRSRRGVGSISDTPGFFGDVDGSVFAPTPTNGPSKLDWVTSIFDRALPLLTQVTQKPGQYFTQMPNGQMVISNTGASPNSALNIGPPSSSNLLLIGGLAIGGLVLFSMMSRGGR